MRPCGSCIPVFVLSRVNTFPRRACPNRAELFLPFVFCLGFSCRVMIYLLTLISFPPSTLSSPSVLSISSQFSLASHPSRRPYNETDPYSKLLRRRSLPVRRTWHIEYSGYYSLLPEFLGRRPFSPAVALDLLVILWGMMLGGVTCA